MPPRKSVSKHVPEAPKSLLVFVDGPALNAMQNRMGFQIDHQALKDVLTAIYDVVEFRYYARGYIEKKAGSFIAALASFGYTVEYSKDEEDVDPMIVADIHKMFNKAKVIMLVGGDHIFAEPLQEAKDNGKKIVVVCPTRIVMLAEAVKAVADEIIDPADMKDKVIDHVRTDKFADSSSPSNGRRNVPAKPDPINLVAQFSAIGIPIKIETYDDEIIIRIKIIKTK